MISEKEFSSGFSSFWSDCLPLLRPQLIAEFNLRGSPMLERSGTVSRPLASKRDKSNNDVIAEMAFGLFADAVNSRKDVLALATDKGKLEDIGRSAIRRVFRLRSHWGKKMSEIEMPADEVVELAVRLESFFASRTSADSIVIQPPFKGCGLLESCFGDIFAAKCLYESKMVDRNLRSVDLRQLLSYCALNYRSSQYSIERVAVVNARRAITYEFTLEELARRTAAKGAGELLHLIAEFLCEFDTAQQRS